MSSGSGFVFGLCDGSSIEVPTAGVFLPHEEAYTGVVQSVLFTYLGKSGHPLSTVQTFFKSFGRSFLELVDGGQRGFCEFINQNNDLVARIQGRGPLWLSREFCDGMGPDETIDQRMAKVVGRHGDFWASVIQYEDGRAVAEEITASSNALYYALDPSDAALYILGTETILYPKHWGMGGKRIVPAN